MLLLLLSACGPTREQGPMEGRPTMQVQAPAGTWTARSDEDRRLVAQEPGGAPVLLDEGVLPELALSQDGTRLAWARGGPETVLVWSPLPPDGTLRVVDASPCAKDRPAFSPDGRRLAFVSGCSGIASLWVLDLDSPSPPLQVTNVGLTRVPGQEPQGFVPPPEGRDLTWQGDTLVWTARGRTWSARVP